MSNSFFKIYTGDYSQDGYDDGINDSKSKEPKNGFGVLKAVHPANYIWNFNNAYDSYSINYKTGYKDGQRVNHDIYNSKPPGGGPDAGSPPIQQKRPTPSNGLNQQTGASMLDNDRYENHLRMLNEVRQNLVSLKRYMSERRDEYKQQINSAGSAGFEQDYIEPLNEKYHSFSQKLDNMTSLLERHDNYIEKQEANIQRLIAMAQQTN